MKKLQFSVVGDPAVVISLVEFDTLVPGPGQAAVVKAAYREVIDLVADGTLSARVDRTVALDDFQDAFALANKPGREGKILFTFD